MSDSATLPSLDDALALGLTESEYGLICEKQGRAPNQVELAMYSLLWSEHCAYKHSKKLLRTLPTEGPSVVMGPGENAGAVDLGDGLVCAFKVESHNHPSAVEPFQGAATGVGGILRDIFAIGARPIAVLDSLRFGEPHLKSSPFPVGKGGRSEQEKGAHQGPGDAGGRSRYLLERAVAGIGHYGNSIGVPTIGGEVYFEAPYEQNCLVNAMALGIARREQLVTSAAVGVGNTVLLFGASTGRDGIGGASVLASAELGEDDDKRPTVQVGDPFEEKKLMECSLELLERGLLVSLQDLGAAGLTSSASEMASKGEVGIDIDVAQVPLREPDMEPFEIMVSESQERMLCVVEPEKVDAVLELCEKWEVSGAPIGTVTDTGQMRVFKDGVLVGSMPVRALVDDCPLYDLKPGKPTGTTYPAPQALLPPQPSRREVSGGGTATSGWTGNELLLALLSSANIASRRSLFEQYDAVVQSRTIRRPEQADAAVLAVRPLG
ncbi:MAG: phosphoribosylformylglycinamidine synthase subunit PurL, partial [Solirubrobacteraceae bacterium]